MQSLLIVLLMILSLPALAQRGPPMTEPPHNFVKNAPLVLASKQVIGPHRLPVEFAFRLKPNNANDSGWVFWSGHETQEFINNNSNTVVCPLSSFLQMDPSLQDLLKQPIGTAWERDSPTGTWREVPGYLKSGA
jgi:hypothetical protein